MSKIAVIANTQSRGGTGWRGCATLLASRKDVMICELGSAPLDDLLQKAFRAGAQSIVAAGGDGTVSAVVDALVRSQVPVKLGVLPTGTLNHFAKDLHIPADLTAAMNIIDEGHTIQIDVAKLNDRHFINNSSVGVYPALVSARTGFERRGIQKWVALARVLLSLHSKRLSFTVSFGKGNSVVEKKTTSIFIGNNKYVMQGLNIGRRASLTEGVLFVSILKSVHARALPRIFYKLFMGRGLSEKDLDVTGLQECTIGSSDERILVAYDGEVALMQAPLHYSIQPKALTVIVPHI